MTASSQAELTIGDRGPDFAVLDHAGASTTPLADAVAGRPIILVFEAEGGSAIFLRELRRYAELSAEFAAHGATIFPISFEPVETLHALRAREKLPFALHSDARGDVVKGNGARGDVARAHGVQQRSRAGAPVSIVMDPNYRVQAILAGGTNEPHAETALRHLGEEAARPGRRRCSACTRPSSCCRECSSRRNAGSLSISGTGRCAIGTPMDTRPPATSRTRMISRSATISTATSFSSSCGMPRSTRASTPNWRARRPRDPARLPILDFEPRALSHRLLRRLGGQRVAGAP